MPKKRKKLSMGNKTTQIRLHRQTFVYLSTSSGTKLAGLGGATASFKTLKTR